MSYMIPLAFVRISPSMSICASRMLAMVSTDTLLGRRIVRDERRARTLLNGAGKEPVKTAIIMDNGTVVASSYPIKIIERNIAYTNNKLLGLKRKKRKGAQEVTEEDIVPSEEELAEAELEIPSEPDEEEEEGGVPFELILDDDDDENIDALDEIALSALADSDEEDEEVDCD